MKIQELNQRQAGEVFVEMGIWDYCLVRYDGRIEWQCKHGVGHTIWYTLESDSIHGCCHKACCVEMNKKIKSFLKEKKNEPN